MKKQKIILWDVETFPHQVDVWSLREADALSVHKYSELAAVSWKELGKPAVYCITREKQKSDKQLVKALHKVLSSADILIAHNGDEFDMKTARARMAFHNLPPLSPKKSIDTLKVAKRHFRFPSNRLNELGKFLGLGEKVATGGYDLWKSCRAGDPKAWKLMEEYNRQDVLLLERVYMRLRPHIENHPRVNPERPEACPKCGSTRLFNNGWCYRTTTKIREYMCRDCGGYFRGGKAVSLKARP